MRNFGIPRIEQSVTDEIDRKALCFGLGVAAPLMLIAFALFVMAYS